MRQPMRKPGYRLEQLDSEAVLYLPGENRVLYCNPTAALIWQLCDGRQTVTDIISQLEAAYPEEAGAIRADVEETVKTMVDYGALEFS